MFFQEAWEAVEDGELDSFEVDDPEEISGSATSTVELALIVDADFDPRNRKLTTSRSRPHRLATSDSANRMRQLLFRGQLETGCCFRGTLRLLRLL